MTTPNFCIHYCGVACMDGSCPQANRAEYEERGIPFVERCDECPEYRGCKDCCWYGEDECPEMKGVIEHHGR